MTGAMSERQKPSGKFVRRMQTAKSYGTLISLPWGPKKEGTDLFPNAVADGGIFDKFNKDGRRVLVVDWAIPKVCRSYVVPVYACRVIMLLILAN